MFYSEASPWDNARWYDPSLGRFTQADTIVPDGVQGLDRYVYVNNSPMNYVDPSGHEYKTPCELKGKSMSKSLKEKNNNRIRNSIYKLSKYTNLSLIVYAPMIIAGILFFSGVEIGVKIYGDSLPSTYTGILLTLVWLIASLSGLIQVSIEEIPSFAFSIRGKFAVYLGIFWTLFFIFAAIASIWYYLLQ